MSFEAMDYMLCHAEVTNGAAIWVLMGLARHANEQGVAWPSVQTLGDYAGVQDRAVRKALRQLEDDGYIVTTRGGRGGDRRTNRYQLMLNACSCPRGANGHIRHVPTRRSVRERGLGERDTAEDGGPGGPPSTGPDGPVPTAASAVPGSEIGVHLSQVPVQMDRKYRSRWTAEDIREDTKKTSPLRTALRAAAGDDPTPEATQPPLPTTPPSKAPFPKHPTQNATHRTEVSR